MKSTCFLGIAVLDHLIGCFAGQLGLMKITVQTKNFEVCQRCLLEDAGALFVEEYGKDTRRSTSYFVVGLVDYIKTNLIKCYTPRLCRGLQRTPVISKIEEGEQSIFGINVDRLSSKSVGCQTKSETSLMLSNKSVDQTSLISSEKKSKPLCLFRPNNSYSFLCEACFKKKSDTGSMEKYTTYFMERSEVYVIYTSDTDSFIELCHEFQMCSGHTIVFPDNLCTIFKHKISPAKSQGESADTLPHVNNGNDNFQIWPVNSNEKYDLEALAKMHHAILLQSYCVSTIRAHDRGRSCWWCLQKLSGGMVVLDRVKTFGSGDKGEQFLVYLLANSFSDLVLTNCEVGCGKVDLSHDCMLDAVHTDNLTPTYDIFAIMRRKESVQQVTRVSDLYGECFLIQHLHDEDYKCRACFPDSAIHELSSLAFLLSLSEDTNSAFDLKCLFSVESRCMAVHVMPYLICSHELNRIKINTDLNLRLHGDDASSSVSATSHVEAKVTLYNWTDEENNDKDNLIECFQCLTRKRSVVVLSVLNQYLWMVEYKLGFPDCPPCGDKMKPGPQIPYNHNLRQILAQDVHLSFGIVQENKNANRMCIKW